VKGKAGLGRGGGDRGFKGKDYISSKMVRSEGLG